MRQYQGEEGLVMITGRVKEAYKKGGMRFFSVA